MKILLGVIEKHLQERIDNCLLQLHISIGYMSVPSTVKLAGTLAALEDLWHLYLESEYLQNPEEFSENEWDFIKSSCLEALSSHTIENSFIAAFETSQAEIKRLAS